MQLHFALSHSKESYGGQLVFLRVILYATFPLNRVTLIHIPPGLIGEVTFMQKLAGGFSVWLPLGVSMMH